MFDKTISIQKLNLRLLGNEDYNLNEQRKGQNLYKYNYLNGNNALSLKQRVWFCLNKNFFFSLFDEHISANY